MELKDRFLKYVSFDTQSSEDSESFPSTDKQLVLLNYLADEMRALGLEDVTVDKYGYAMGTIPASEGYENAPVRENEDDKYTRLIVEGKLNGMTYYYPIVFKSVIRNNCYSVDITIKRPGSLDPGTDINKGSMDTTISIVDWNVHDSSEIEF